MYINHHHAWHNQVAKHTCKIAGRYRANRPAVIINATPITTTDTARIVTCPPNVHELHVYKEACCIGKGYVRSFNP